MQGYFFYMKYSVTWLTGKRVENNLSTELQGGKGSACATYECTHSYLKYLQQEKKAPKFEKSYLCTLQHHFQLCFTHSWSETQLGSALVHHTLFALMFWRNVAIFGKRWNFQNKISSVLFAGWPSGSGRSAGFAANWTTTPGRIRLSSHRNGIFQNERGTAVFFLLLFLSINVNVYNVLVVLLWDFWALWPSHFKLSGIGTADIGTALLFTCLSCAFFTLYTPSWRWLIDMSC